MCGIAGVFEWDRAAGGVSEEVVVRMRETLGHRGPDGHGVFVSDDRRVGFGHRRLAIVDIEGGAQPMFGAGGTCLVFNGEIYNYPALRESLLASGVRFETHSDTEVILHLYQRYGEECVNHLVGMFAFAIWDPGRERVFFARDPIGEKPFYWAERAGTFVFGSEIKALLEHPAVPREVDEGAVSPYLANLVTPGPETLFRGVSKLGPGCSGVCDSGGVRISRYSATIAERRWDGHDPDPAGRVRSLLADSARARLMSDVPVGVLLSGGMDSSTIVALLREQASELASFTVGFPGTERHDEREEARWVAEKFGTDHHEVVLDEDDVLATLPSLIHHCDEPIAVPDCVSLHAVCRLAQRNGIKVVLAGEGSDELFWGYHECRHLVESWRRFQGLLGLPGWMVRLAARATSGRRRPERREQLEGIAAGRVPPVHMPAGFTAYQRGRLLRSGTALPGWAPGRRPPGEDALSTVAFDTYEYEFDVRLPELLLMRIDRCSMANGVEARVPFLDPALVDYAYRLPLDRKVHGGDSKLILKQAVAGIVPDRIAERRKQGFASPTARWFAARHGDLLRDLLGQDTLRAYFDVEFVETLLRAVDADAKETAHVLWPILTFGLWHKHWIEAEPLDELVSEALAA